ncbi:DUF2637 domain-containing protein [Streptomyces luteolifulvus]|jgi:hypothetical protein|uniref:DUF2637 domain-containing protein n=1 Tax=Streptomyces luteolifulvus TaxID=2615112 RepID=A0A6H9UQJ6_9ACTN|nr:DUF2637 domain-containing protein [Streptomyces luteolifulvus]KAB1140751.1 DUF2637 domain-containing protein [Streptomyces luteolifulvus]
MNDERTDYHSGFYAGHLGPYDMGGTGRHRRADVFQEPLVPPDPTWDPAEELAYLLQDAMAAERVPSAPPVRDEAPAGAPPPGSPLRNLQDITAELPPLRTVPQSHRKLREPRRVSGLRTLSYLIAALAAVITSMVSVFGGMATYEPLRLVAVFHTRSDSVSWWPLLVYGPWLVAALSILRAALHRCRAMHSWVVVLLFSFASVLLCVVQARGTLTDAAAAALPSCASLACFQQLVRQITLTRPHRRGRPRHRLRLTAMNSPFVDRKRFLR